MIQIRGVSIAPPIMAIDNRTHSIFHFRGIYHYFAQHYVSNKAPGNDMNLSGKN